MCTAHALLKFIIFKASQPRGRASGSHAYERHEMQGVIIKCTRDECSVFVNLRPHLLRIRSRHQFSLPEKNRLPHTLLKFIVRETTGRNEGLTRQCTDNHSLVSLLPYAYMYIRTYVCTFVGSCLATEILKAYISKLKW